MRSVPNYNELLKVLDDLCNGKASREEVSKWAVAIIDDESVRIFDEAVLDVLKNLGSSDLPSSDRDYLYTEIDFRNWAKTLQLGKE